MADKPTTSLLELVGLDLDQLVKHQKVQQK